MAYRESGHGILVSRLDFEPFFFCLESVADCTRPRDCYKARRARPRGCGQAKGGFRCSQSMSP